MVDPLSIAGLVVGIIGIIQGGLKVFSSLWRRLKAAFGGLHSQSKSEQLGLVRGMQG